jgi:hypothetical protein
MLVSDRLGTHRIILLSVMAALIASTASWSLTYSPSTDA